nr:MULTISPECIES: hypothetical protein [unclassified Bradyrhizobium]
MAEAIALSAAIDYIADPQAIASAQERLASTFMDRAGVAGRRTVRCRCSTNSACWRRAVGPLDFTMHTERSMCSCVP